MTSGEIWKCGFSLAALVRGFCRLAQAWDELWRVWTHQFQGRMGGVPLVWSQSVQL